jgi:hypothetical protein
MAPPQLKEHSCDHCRRLVLREKHMRIIGEATDEDYSHSDLKFHHEFQLTYSDLVFGCLGNCLLFLEIKTNLYLKDLPEESANLQMCYCGLQLAFGFWAHDDYGTVTVPKQRVPRQDNLYCFTPSGSPASCIVHSTPVETEPLTPLTAKRIKQWLHDCQENHSNCVIAPEAALPGCPPIRPKRLIKITNVPGDQPPRLQVIETYSETYSESDVEASPPRFAALSYCWGGETLGMLTCNYSSASSFLSDGGIPWTTLPETIRDAVTVCQTLDTEFIWIDLL